MCHWRRARWRVADTQGTPDYLQYYRSIVDEKGPGFDATGWRNPEYQLQRFRVMTEMYDFANKVVLDAGAGLGAERRLFGRVFDAHSPSPLR